MSAKDTSSRMKAVENIVKEIGDYMEASGTGAEGVADILETSAKLILEGLSVQVTLTRCGSNELGRYAI